MLEYIQFYTKNLSNFAILLLIGVSIAILDITLRNVVRGVYLNVRENMNLRHGGGGREGMKNNADDADEEDNEKEKEPTCPKDCSAVESLRKKLTGLIENASKLQSDIQANNQTIKYQQRIIENMQKSVQKLVEKSNK